MSISAGLLLSETTPPLLPAPLLLTLRSVQPPLLVRRCGGGDGKSEPEGCANDLNAEWKWDEQEPAVPATWSLQTTPAA
jgi:hypothetical protein